MGKKDKAEKEAEAALMEGLRRSEADKRRQRQPERQRVPREETEPQPVRYREVSNSPREGVRQLQSVHDPDPVSDELDDELEEARSTGTRGTSRSLGKEVASTVTHSLPKTDLDLFVDSIVDWLSDEQKGKELFSLLTKFAEPEEREEFENILRFVLVEVLKMGALGMYNLRETKEGKTGWSAAGKIGSVSVMNMLKYVNMCMVESKKRGNWSKQKALGDKDIAELKEHVRWVDYAANAYETPKFVGRIIDQNLTNRVNLPVYVFAALPTVASDGDGANEELVISVRGTEQLGDVFTNVNASSFPFPELNESGANDNFVHRGMYFCAHNIYKKLEDKLALICTENQQRWEQLEKSGAATRIVVTGHSLGAATAIILTLLIRLRLDGPFKVNLRCFVIAPPACMSGKIALDLCKKHVRSVILGDDIVPRLTVEGASQLIKILTSDSFVKAYGPAFLDKWSSSFGLSGNIANALMGVAKDIWMDGNSYEALMRDKLVPPGRITHLLVADRKLTKDVKRAIQDEKSLRAEMEKNWKLAETEHKSALIAEKEERQQLRKDLERRRKSLKSLKSSERAEAEKKLDTELKRLNVRAKPKESRKHARERRKLEKLAREEEKKEHSRQLALSKRRERRERTTISVLLDCNAREFDLLPITPLCVSHHFLEEYVDALDIATRDVLSPEDYAEAQALHTRVFGAPYATHRGDEGHAPGSLAPLPHFEPSDDSDANVSDNESEEESVFDDDDLEELRQRVFGNQADSYPLPPIRSPKQSSPVPMLSPSPPPLPERREKKGKSKDKEKRGKSRSKVPPPKPPKPSAPDFENENPPAYYE